MAMQKIIGENSRLAQEDARRLNENLAVLEAASHAGVTASASELNIMDGGYVHSGVTINTSGSVYLFDTLESEANSRVGISFSFLAEG